MTKVYAALKTAVLGCFIACSVVNADVVLKVTGDNVNLRAIADGESEVVSQVSRGIILHADKFTGEEWVGVTVPSGVVVWAYAELIRDNIVAVSKLSVRSGPGINYRTVGMLFKGDKVVSHGTVNGWMKIDAPANCRVWINSKYVEVVGSVTKNMETPIVKLHLESIEKTTEPVIKRVVPTVNVTTRPTVKSVVPVVNVTTKPVVKATIPVDKPITKLSVVAPAVTEKPEVKPAKSIKPMKPLVIEPATVKPEVVVPVKPEVVVPVKPEVVVPVKPETEALGIEKTVVKPVVEERLVDVKQAVVEPVLVKEAVISVSELEPIVKTSTLVETPSVEVVSEIEQTGESIAELVAMSSGDVVEKEVILPVTESASEEPVVPLVEKGVATPEVVSIPEIINIRSNDVIVSSIKDPVVYNTVIAGEVIDVVDVPVVETVDIPVVEVADIVVVEPSVDDIAPVVSIDTSVVVDSEPKEVICVEPEVVKPNKYFIINTNDIPEGIDSDRLVLSMRQGQNIVLTGKLKHSGRVLRRRPSSYRIVDIDDDYTGCYLLPGEYNLESAIGSNIKVEGKSYWIQGIRDMVVAPSSIKKISTSSLLP